jgi:hypothetical protein
MSISITTIYHDCGMLLWPIVHLHMKVYQSKEVLYKVYRVPLVHDKQFGALKGHHIHHLLTPIRPVLKCIDHGVEIIHTRPK